MIRYTKDNPNMIRRRSEIKHKKTAPGKKRGGICCKIQGFPFGAVFLRIKKEGQGFLPGI